MGFKVKKKIFNVAWGEPHPLAGLFMRTQAASVKEFASFARGLMEVGAQYKANQDTEDQQLQVKIIEETAAALETVKIQFAEKLISWNLEDDEDKPIPATVDGVLSLEDEFCMNLISAWLDAIGGVSEDLGKDLTSGGTFQDLSLPMELKLPNHQS